MPLVLSQVPNTQIAKNPTDDAIWHRWFEEVRRRLELAGQIDHNTLADLQGGTTDEYYHLTAAQHTTLTAAKTANTVYAGPTTGAPAIPAFRALVAGDLPAGVGTVTSVNVSGGTTGLTATGGPITSSGTITLGGTLITSNGGTGLSSWTAGDLPYYATGTALSKLAIGTSTHILTSSGTAPQWTNPTGITVGTATVASTVTVADAASDTTTFPVLAGSATGNLPMLTDAGLTYNASTNLLTAGLLSGGNVTVTASTVPANGIYLPTANELGFATSTTYAGRVDSGQRFLLGATASQTIGNANRLQVAGTTAATNSLGISAWSSDALGARIELGKSRGTSVGTNSIVSSGDTLGIITAYGDNGTTFTNAAAIAMEVDGTPGATNDMPGRIVFQTTPDGSGTLTEAARIDSAQRLLIGHTASVSAVIQARVQLTGTEAAGSSLSVFRYSADAGGGAIRLNKSRNASAGSNTIVNNNDTIGGLYAAAANGTSYTNAAAIQFEIDGTPGATNDMPGRIVFETTPDGSGTRVEAMRIDNAQKTIFQVDRALRFNNQTSAAAANVGTLNNAPAAGNPGYWLKINIAGTNYAVPCWAG